MSKTALFSDDSITEGDLLNRGTQESLPHVVAKGARLCGRTLKKLQEGPTVVNRFLQCLTQNDPNASRVVQ